MKRISVISILVLFIGLAWAALLALAGGPVLGKADVYDPVVHVNP